MPLYEYKCESCGQEKEILRHMDEADDPVPCPVCNKPMKRKISLTSFILVGGGWAADGYK